MFDAPIPFDPPDAVLPRCTRSTWRHHQRPDLVAQARRLVEESGLGRDAIAATLGVGVATITNWRRRFGWCWAPGKRRGRRPVAAGVARPKLSRRAGPGRAHPAATVAAVRGLVEAGELTRDAIAAETGVGIQTIRRWAAAGHWALPPRQRREARVRPERIVVGPPRFRRGRGRRYVPDVVERVRVLVEGSGLSQADIAAQTGIAQASVARWTLRHGWRRPAEAPRWTRLMATARSGLGPRAAAAFERLAAVAARVAETGDAGDGARARAVAAAASGLAAHLARTDDRRAPRLPGSPPRRRDRPRPETLVEEARHLVESTTWPQSDIARRLGVSKPTLIAWTQQGRWQRPPDAPARYGVPGRSRRRSLRAEQRDEGRHRLDEAERRLAVLEGDGGADAGFMTRDARTEGLDALSSPLWGGVGGGGGPVWSDLVPSGPPPSGPPLRSDHLPHKGEGMTSADACAALLDLLRGAIAIVQRRIPPRRPGLDA